MATYTYKHYTYSKTHPAATWYMEVTESEINQKDNTSKITVKFYVKATHNKTRSDTYNNYPAGYGKSTPYSRFYVDGVRMKEVIPANFDCRYNSAKKVANGTKYNLGTYTQTIKHNSDGAKSVTITCVHWTSVSPQEVKLTTGKMALTKITPYRTTWLTVPGGTHYIGNNITIQANPSSTNLTHALNVSLDNANWVNIQNGLKFSKANAANNYTFKIPDSFKNKIVSQSYGTMYVKLSTWINGSYIGVETKTVSIYNNNEKYSGSFTLSSKMPKTDGKYVWNSNSKIITDLRVIYDYVPISVSYTITGPNGYSYYKWYDTVEDRVGLDIYLHWPNKPGATGTHTFTSPAVPYKGTYTITVVIVDGRANNTGPREFRRTLTVTFEEPVKKPTELGIKGFVIHGSTYSENGKYIVGKTNPKVSLTFYTDYKIKSIDFIMSGANSSTRSMNTCSFVPGTTCKTTAEMGVIKKAGSNTIKAIITAEGGKTTSATLTFTGYEERKYLSIQDSYIDSTLAKGLVNNSYYKGHSRLGIRIKISHSHSLKSLTATIGSKTYDLKSYMYDNAAYTCSDKFTTAGNVNITLTVKDVNGLSSSKTMTVFVDEEINPPTVPKIEFEHKSDNYIFLSEGEKITFTGKSTNLADYQIIYVLSSCDVFKATEIYTSNNSYNDADRSQMDSRLRSNATGALRYHIFKDFGKTNAPITQDSNVKNKFHLHPTSPGHTTNDKYYALQWFSRANPGDLLYIYVRERVKKEIPSSHQYLYSDSYNYDNIPKNKLFAMCVIPPAPGAIQIYEKQRTSDKYVIQYKNPIYNMSLGSKNPIHLIDVCLVAHDSKGNVLNTSTQKRRDALNGKTWMNYSDRKWHNIVPNNLSQKNNKEFFEMEFDISKYPVGSNISVIAFYYPDYYIHPSIYSTSNVLRTSRQTLKLNLAFQSPANNSASTVANPEIKVRVTPTSISSAAETEPLYTINHATSWSATDWSKNPIWFRNPRSQDSQYPNFRKADVYAANNYYTINSDYPNHKVEHYKAQENVYKTNTFSISNVKTKGQGIYKDNRLYLKLEQNIVDLGDLYTDILLNKQYQDFTWSQPKGKFLKLGENKIQAYTSPYKYGEIFTEINEINGYWLSDNIFISHSIMPYNYFRSSIIRPSSEKDWSSVSSSILEVKIPYKKLVAGNDYSITFTSNANNGFNYDEGLTYQVKNNDEVNDMICTAYMFTELKYKSSSLTNVSYEEAKKHIVYRPKYAILGTSTTRSLVNNYNKAVDHTIRFKAPSSIDGFTDEDMFSVLLSVRGIDKMTISNMKLNNLTKSKSEYLTSNQEIDSQIKENIQTITVHYVGYSFNFNYINPLYLDEHLSLREYLLGMASQYNLKLTPPWRELEVDEDYLMARDYNDIKDFCYTLFSTIKKNYSVGYKGNPEEFKNLPTIKPGDKRGPANIGKGKTYFPEWDDLIDVIKRQIIGTETPAPEPEFIRCTGINIIEDRIPMPQNGKKGDRYNVSYEVFPKNCMEKVTWSIDSTEFATINNAVITRSVDNINLETETKNETITKQVGLLQGYYDSKDGVLKYHKNVVTTEKFNLYDIYQATGSVTIEIRDKNPNGYTMQIGANDMSFYKDLNSIAGYHCKSDYWIDQTAGELVEDPKTGAVRMTFKKSYKLDNLLSQYPYMSCTVYGLMDWDSTLVPSQLRMMPITYTVANSTTGYKEKTTKITARCGAYSDSAVLYVVPNTSTPASKIGITSYKINGEQAINKTELIYVEDKATVDLVVSTIRPISKVVLDITGENAQVIQQAGSGNSTGTLHFTMKVSPITGRNTFKIKVYDVDGATATATASVKSYSSEQVAPQLGIPPQATIMVHKVGSYNYNIELAFSCRHSKQFITNIITDVKSTAGFSKRVTSIVSPKATNVFSRLIEIGKLPTVATTYAVTCRILYEEYGVSAETSITTIIYTNK